MRPIQILPVTAHSLAIYLLPAAVAPFNVPKVRLQSPPPWCLVTQKKNLSTALFLPSD